MKLFLKKIGKILTEIWCKLFKDVHSKYRIVLMNEGLKEIFSFRLSRFNVIVGGSVAIFLIVSATTILIAFTPLKQFIPGYTRQGFVAMTFDNRVKIDSLTNVVETQSLMLDVLQNVLENTIPVDTGAKINDSLKNYSNIGYRISLEDSILRKDIEKQKL